LEKLNLVVLMIAGIHFGSQVLVVALGIAEGGEKHVLGVRQGTTENTTVVKGLLEDLVDRGLDRERRYLLVIDGSKALRAGVQRVFGEQAEVQRCQIHKRRNVKEHLPENCQKDYDRRIRNAYAMTNYADAKEALEKIFRQLERINPSAVLQDQFPGSTHVHSCGLGSASARRGGRFSSNRSFTLFAIPVCVHDPRRTPGRHGYLHPSGEEIPAGCPQGSSRWPGFPAHPRP
jgi:hypothetical protein